MGVKSKFWILTASLVTVLVFLGGSRPLAANPSALSLVSPAACPTGGCAAGQRLNFKADFNLSVYDASQAVNVQVCIYAPINWSATSFEPGVTGTITSTTYLVGNSYCGSTPANYDLMGGVYTHMAAGAFGDGIPFTFRLGNSALTDPSGSVLVRVLELNSTNTWSTMEQMVISVPVMATGSVVYVANDAGDCSVSSPCYINSGDDLAGGIGTGLKDAIDSSSSPININLLGDYFIKSSAVLMDHAHTLSGLNNAHLDYQGGDCSQPMLRLTGGGTVRDLTISHGTCTVATRRNLLQLESSAPVLIESNDLIGGEDAVHATGSSSGNIAVQFNHIQGNAGYAIILDPAGTSKLDAVANNIFDNRSGIQVECSNPSRGFVDHNYWGSAAFTSSVSQCTAADTKRLGAPILRNASVPGVSAEQVTASSTQTYAFNNQIGFKYSGPGTNIGLFIVNHGFGSSQNVPFTGSQPGGLVACSNYWDVFLADPTAPAGDISLDLSFKYDTSASCIATIETSSYCSQTTAPENYPLYWYDIGANTWATTGKTPGGQTTACNTADHYIQVGVDNAGGKPSFADLVHAPFVVGLPNQPAGVVFSSLSAEPGDQKAILHWTTSSEVNTNGFVVMRSTSQTSGFNDVSPLIPHLGTNLAGSTYQYTDPNLTNNQAYYYRLRVVNLDMSTILTGTVSATPFPSTPTPTSTFTRTPTLTNTPSVRTATRTRTLFPTSTFIFRTNTPTRTPTPTPTSPFKTVTNTLLAPKTQTGTRAPTLNLVIVSSVPSTPEPGAATQLAYVRQTRTALARLSETPTSTATPVSLTSAIFGKDPLTAVLILMAVVAAGAGAALYFLRDRLHLPA